MTLIFANQRGRVNLLGAKKVACWVGSHLNVDFKR